MTSIYLKVNCGFARVAIRTLSQSQVGKTHSKINTQERAKQFQELFTAPDEYFTSTKGRDSLFDRHCKQILSAFGTMKNADKRQEYIECFSVEKWKKLNQHSKQAHTLATCLECALTHAALQQAFPGPTFQPVPTFTSGIHSLSQDVSSSKLTRHILSELQPVYEATYGTSFIRSLCECKESELQQRPTKVDKRRVKRKLQQDCRDHMHEQMRKTDALNVLAEGQSLKSYKRLRLAQSFETPKQKQSRVSNHPFKEQKHSPKFDNVLWNKDTVLADLRAWPMGNIINWSKFAREHDIPGKNGGQVAKEFAKENGIDVFALDQRPSQNRVIRARKLRMPGQDVSVPTHSTVTEIKEDWNKMIADGTLSLGEPCHPHIVVRYTTSGGALARHEVQVYGRKVPLTTVRENLLKKHEGLMHLHSDEQLQNMEKYELIQFFKTHRIQLPNLQTEDELRKILSQKERTRTLGMWHDHSTILGHGYIMITVRVLYDQAVFKTDTELFGQELFHNIQSFIEEPEIHILGMSSSRAEDQAALVQDRVNCIKELTTNLCTSKGILISDRLVFFYGDKPATQFERGSQQGGHYPCGSCGCDARRFEDLAHCLNYKWRSVQDLQQVATAGKYGKDPGNVRPFEQLNHCQLKEELRARQIYNFGTTKKDARDKLHDSLRGVQRVPSLLINDPTQGIQISNLQSYTILECEPLHDIKGHLSNVLEELPYTLEKEHAVKCKQLLDVDLFKKDTKTGADYRLAAIHQLSLLHRLHAPYKVIKLMETVVVISELLYADDSKRSPQTVLQLYNTTFLHHELCKDLFQETKKISHRKLFGSHLHALVVHAPAQYHIMCLRSCNAEYEERLFGQAKAIAQNTTNRQPNTIVPNILLRLQAKQQKGGMFESMRHTSSWITKEAKGVKMYTSKNTIIERSYIEQRMASWQAHLQRISTFLLPEEGTWWQRTDSGYEFLDGQDTIIREGACPPLLHFRDTNLQDIQIQNELAWNTIITEKKMLPTPFIRLYDSNGDYCGRYVYTGDNVELDQQQSDSGEQMYHCSSADIPSTTTISHDITPCFQQCESTGQLASTCNFQVESTQGSSQDEDMHITLESDNEEEVEKENTKISLKTKLATAISKVLGPSCDCQEDIRKLDNVRSQIKQGEVSVKYVEKHRKLLSLLKAKLHQRQLHLRMLITNYEKRVYTSQHKLPDKATDNEYSTLLRAQNFTSKLLVSPEFN